MTYFLIQEILLEFENNLEFDQNEKIFIWWIFWEFY